MSYRTKLRIVRMIVVAMLGAGSVIGIFPGPVIGISPA
jgi:hypothetical protein